jgi:hypothetical protein
MGRTEAGGAQPILPALSVSAWLAANGKARRLRRANGNRGLPMSRKRDRK